MGAVKHLNNGKCGKCEEILNRFPVEPSLRAWFYTVQAKHPDAHISCAGRGKTDQEEFFKKKASKAHWTQSSHNYGCALDFFQNTQEGAAWTRGWFDSVIGFETSTARIPLKWYGAKGSPFFELPHVELADWKARVARGEVKLVENA